MHLLLTDYDVVCVIGMVPVRVKGPVQMGERMYTSDEDGTAVAESQLNLNGKNETRHYFCTHRHGP